MGFKYSQNHNGFVGFIYCQIHNSLPDSMKEKSHIYSLGSKQLSVQTFHWRISLFVWFELHYWSSKLLNSLAFNLWIQTDKWLTFFYWVTIEDLVCICHLYLKFLLTHIFLLGYNWRLGLYMSSGFKVSFNSHFSIGFQYKKDFYLLFGFQ